MSYSVAYRFPEPNLRLHDGENSLSRFKKYQTTSGFNAHNPLQEDIEYIFGNQGYYGIMNAAASMLRGSKNDILLDLFYTSTSELEPSLYQWNAKSRRKHILTPGLVPTFAVACPRTQGLMYKAYSLSQ